MVICSIEGTRNNVFVTVLGPEKKLIFQHSIGVTKMSNSKKKTVFAAEVLGKFVGDKLRSMNILRINVFLGGGWYRSERGCLEAICRTGIVAGRVQLLSRIAHNGVKYRKRRRK